MEGPKKISSIDEVNNSATSPTAVMIGMQDVAGSSSTTVSGMNKDNKSTKPLCPTARIFVPGALEVQDSERANPRYVYNPYSIFQTTQQAGLGYVYHPYSFLQQNHRAVPGRMMKYAPQMPLFGYGGPGSVSSDRNQIEEAKYDAKESVEHFKGEPMARADMSAKKQKEKGEDGMMLKARKRNKATARRRAKKAAAVGEDVLPAAE